MKNLIFASFIILGTQPSFSHAHAEKDRIEAVLKKVEIAFQPIADRKKWTFIYRTAWNKKKINAHARMSHFSENRRIISVNGEVIRRGASDDALLWPICHELGHHLGGKPVFEIDQMSAEGQSDYWASQVCFPLLFKTAFADSAPRFEANSEYYQLCEKSLPQEADRQICARTLSASMEYAQIVYADDPKSKSEPLSYLIRAPIAQRVYMGHPSRQCRLNTVLAGQLGKPRPLCWYNDRQLTDYPPDQEFP